MTEDDKPVADGSQHNGGQPDPAEETVRLNPQQQGIQPGDGGQTPEPQGRIRHQDAETTTPREPTLAEQKARQAAEKRRLQQEQDELAAAAAKTKVRRRMMIGGGATVGVVALVAAMYSASAISQEASASTQYCSADVSGQAVRDQDDYCDEHYVTSHGGYVHNSMFFMPIPGGGYHSYRYAYTPAGVAAPPIGQSTSGSTYTKPSSSTVKSTSGTTVQRGGFGISSKAGSGTGSGS